MAAARLRKWGHSLGVVLPSDELRRKGLREGDLVEVTVAPAAPSLDAVFGIVKTRKSTAAMIRDARLGEDD